ncbi:hypothetical protein QFC19_004211 [Naganishia cerealis]|uniref:Uncharacterized protein n=1 Tax=Naganishia cerealis TaxID=610337 RepID=A0ACC2VXW8_9TREE|nr:hypothetical protein QFC19_004211 [Naganishia cerealis]
MTTHSAPVYLDSEAKPVAMGLERVPTGEKDLEITSSYGGHLDASARVVPEKALFDVAASKRLARKMDLHNIPIVALCYLFAFIDRTNIGNARLAGLEKDLKLVGFDYNILLSIFYVSYIIFEFPANMFTKWLGPGKAIPLYTIIFGALSIAMAFVKTFGSSLAVRFLLGSVQEVAAYTSALTDERFVCCLHYRASEAGMLPGIAYYLSRWYTKEELAFRLAMYLVCSPLAGAFGGLLASGILTISHVGWLTRWRLIFMIEGIITTVIGLAAYLLLTDRPATARWLSPEEKELAELRVRNENVGAPVAIEKLNWKGVKAGILAPSTIVLAFIFGFNNVTVQYIVFLATTKPQARYAGVFLINIGAFVFGPSK